MEFWFDFGSNYSYLSVMRIEPLAAEHGVSIEWRPFLLGPIFKSLGWDTSPFVLQRTKGAYMWRDVERQCARYRLPWKQPTVFPRRALLPLRVALLGAEEPWIGAFCREIMLMNFRDDRDIDAPEPVADALAGLGLAAQEIITQAQSEAHKALLRTQTELAARRGIFGAPTFFVGEEMFWGNDRLEEALAWAKRAA
jgi:2-hydroxychromene-2-carboxylate isomerase